ncbi:hypothetical protein V2G26_013389 [Clonostachys chloroleuca]
MELLRQDERKLTPQIPQNRDGNAPSEILCPEKPDDDRRQFNNDPTCRGSGLGAEMGNLSKTDPIYGESVSSMARVLQPRPASLPSMEFSEMKGPPSAHPAGRLERA